MASALFDVNADGADQGYEGSNSEVLELRLRQQPPIGVNTVVFQVFDPAGFDPNKLIAANPPRASKGAPTLTLVGASSGQAVSPASVDGTVSITLPATGSHSWILRCIVNGGTRTLPNGIEVVDPSLIHERGIWIAGALGIRRVVCTETRQFEDDGWAGALADFPDFVVGDHTITYPKLPAAVAAPSVVGASVNGNFGELTLTALIAAIATGAIPLAKLPALASAPSVLGRATNGAVSELTLTAMIAAIATGAIPLAKLPALASAPSVLGGTANGAVGEMTVTTLGAQLAAKVQGLLLRAPQRLSSGTSINHPTGTRLVHVYGCGAGGAGGGTDAAQGSMGANGGSGTYGERWILVGSLTSSYVIGAPGAGVPGAAGNAGADTTFTHGATTMTLPGGGGGQHLPGGTSIARAAGGAPGGAATNADFSVPGQRGGSAARFGAIASALHMHCGPAGSTPLGNGGGPALSLASGLFASEAGSGLGSGGAGVVNGTTSVATAGATGAPGGLFVEEYA